MAGLLIFNIMILTTLKKSKFCGEILTFLDRAVEEANSVKLIHFNFFVIIDINTVLQFLSMFLAFGIFPETCPTFPTFVSLVIHF